MTFIEEAVLEIQSLVSYEDCTSVRRCDFTSQSTFCSSCPREPRVNTIAASSTQAPASSTPSKALIYRYTRCSKCNRDMSCLTRTATDHHRHHQQQQPQLGNSPRCPDARDADENARVLEELRSIVSHSRLGETRGDRSTRVASITLANITIDKPPTDQPMDTSADTKERMIEMETRPGVKEEACSEGSDVEMKEMNASTTTAAAIASSSSYNTTGSVAISADTRFPSSSSFTDGTTDADDLDVLSPQTVEMCEEGCADATPSVYEAHSAALAMESERFTPGHGAIGSYAALTATVSDVDTGTSAAIRSELFHSASSARRDQTTRGEDSCRAALLGCEDMVVDLLPPVDNDAVNPAEEGEAEEDEGGDEDDESGEDEIFKREEQRRAEELRAQRIKHAAKKARSAEKARKKAALQKPPPKVLPPQCVQCRSRTENNNVDENQVDGDHELMLHDGRDLVHQSPQHVVYEYVEGEQGYRSAALVAHKCRDLVSNANVYFLGDIANLPQVKALKKSPERKVFNLINLFAYGDISSYIRNKHQYPQLNQEELKKLRKLTLLSLCSKKSVIKFIEIQEKLFMEDAFETEQIILGCLFGKLIVGKINQFDQELCITNMKGRDPIDPINLLNSLHLLSTGCNRILSVYKRCNKTKGTSKSSSQHHLRSRGGHQYRGNKGNKTGKKNTSSSSNSANSVALRNVGKDAKGPNGADKNYPSKKNHQAKPAGSSITPPGDQCDKGDRHMRNKETNKNKKAHSGGEQGFNLNAFNSQTRQFNSQIDNTISHNQSKGNSSKNAMKNYDFAVNQSNVKNDNKKTSAFNSFFKIHENFLKKKDKE